MIFNIQATAKKKTSSKKVVEETKPQSSQEIETTEKKTQEEQQQQSSNNGDSTAQNKKNNSTTSKKKKKSTKETTTESDSTSTKDSTKTTKPTVVETKKEGNQSAQDPKTQNAKADQSEEKANEETADPSKLLEEMQEQMSLFGQLEKINSPQNQELQQKMQRTWMKIMEIQGKFKSIPPQKIWPGDIMITISDPNNYIETLTTQYSLKEIMPMLSAQTPIFNLMFWKSFSEQSKRFATEVIMQHYGLGEQADSSISLISLVKIMSTEKFKAEYKKYKSEELSSNNQLLLRLVFQMELELPNGVKLQDIKQAMTNNSLPVIQGENVTIALMNGEVLKGVVKNKIPCYHPSMVTFNNGFFLKIFLPDTRAPQIYFILGELNEPSAFINKENPQGCTMYYTDGKELELNDKQQQLLFLLTRVAALMEETLQNTTVTDANGNVDNNTKEFQQNLQDYLKTEIYLMLLRHYSDLLINLQ